MPDQVTVAAHQLEIGLWDAFWTGKFDEAVVVLKNVLACGNGKQAGVMQQVLFHLIAHHVRQYHPANPRGAYRKDSLVQPPLGDDASRENVGI